MFQIFVKLWWYGKLMWAVKACKNIKNKSFPQIFRALLWLSFGHFPLAAILKLSTDIGICAVDSPEVRPVCLPDRGLVLPDWTECEISGYGKDAECKWSFTWAASRGQCLLTGFYRCWWWKLSPQSLQSSLSVWKEDTSASGPKSAAFQRSCQDARLPPTCCVQETPEGSMTPAR